MFKTLRARWKQGFRTVGFPDKPPTLPQMFRGRPQWDIGKCKAGEGTPNAELCVGDPCTACVEACPTGALRKKGNAMSIDLGRCLFCTDCTDACPTQAIEFTTEYRMATRERDALVVDGRAYALAKALDGEAHRLFGRSLKLREVSAGGCNACEADTNVLGTIVFDLGRFGIQFVASPRHADGLLITGSVPQNMTLALKKTYEATPAPKLVIAVGACAISGGVFAQNPEAGQGAGGIVPVDLYIPGCPPHPITILDGLLRLLDRLPRGS